MNHSARVMAVAMSSVRACGRASLAIWNFIFGEPLVVLNSRTVNSPATPTFYKQAPESGTARRQDKRRRPRRSFRAWRAATRAPLRAVRAGRGAQGVDQYLDVRLKHRPQLRR